MKFFHLADLHIGKTVNGFSMLEDQRFIFAQVIEYIATEQPDAVLLCGDIYDKTVPGADAVALYDDLLTALAGTGVPALVISGNHDSPERLAFAGRLLESSGIHMYGQFDGSLHAVTLADAFGEVDFYMLPFIRPAAVRPFFPDASIESYTDAVTAALEGAATGAKKRSVLLAHQYVTSRGEEPLRAESETEPVGGLNAVDAALFAPFCYVALGHLHGAQKIGSERVRYGGSPLKYSFSEWRQQKSVAMVELNAEGGVQTTLLPLSPRHDMRKIRGPIDALLRADVVNEVDPLDYLHITLTDEQHPPDAHGRLRAVYPNMMDIEFDNSRTRAASAFTGDAAVEQKTAAELLADFFAEQNGRPMNPAQQALAETLLRKAEGTL